MFQIGKRAQVLLVPVNSRQGEGFSWRHLLGSIRKHRLRVCMNKPGLILHAKEIGSLLLQECTCCRNADSGGQSALTPCRKKHTKTKAYLFLGPFSSFRTFAAGPLGSGSFAFLNQAREPLLTMKLVAIRGQAQEPFHV